MNREKLLALLFIIVFTCMGCSRNPSNNYLYNGNAIVAGRINNLSEGTKTIRFASGSTINDIEKTVLVDSLGHFKVVLAMSNPQNVQIFFKRGIGLLFLKPNDSIFIELDESLFNNNRFPIYDIYGTSSSVSVTREIQKYFKVKSEGKPFSPNVTESSIKEYYKSLEKELSYQDSILNNYLESTSTNHEFKVWVEKEIRYNVANYLEDFLIFNPEFRGNAYNKSVFPVDDDEAIIYADYPLLLRHYALNTYLWRDSANSYSYKNEMYLNAYSKALSGILKAETEGLSRDIMCYKILSELFKESYEDFKTLINDIDTIISNPILKEELNKKRVEFESQTNYSISLLDPEDNYEKEISGDFWTKLKEKHSGKVIYMDIWATWCGPCKSEIPFSIELHQHFDKEDIVFVNLCLASSRSDWQSMMAGNILSGENYFFDKDQSNLLRDKLKFEGFPTYLIVDKNGNLVNNNAFRPSSGEKIITQLESYLKTNAP